MTVTVDTDLGDRLLALWESAPLPKRSEWIRKLLTAADNGDPAELHFLMDSAARVYGTPWGLWRDDPVGFTHDVLDESLTRRQAEIFESVRDHPFTAVPSCFASGKCVPHNEYVQLADGSVVGARDLVGREFHMLGWSSDGQQTVRRARATWNRVEPVYRLTTDSGRTVTRNGAHPLWAAAIGRQVHKGGPGTGSVVTPRGWVSLREIQAGDAVLVPEIVRTVGDGWMPPEEAALLGYLLGDGSTTVDVRFTQMPGPALDEVLAISKKLGIRVAHLPYQGKAADIGLRGKVALELVERWGIRGCKARTKRVPADLWRCSADVIAIVAGRLFSCDGYVHVRTQNAGREVRDVYAALSLTNEGLVRDFHRMMLRLGITGSVSSKPGMRDGKPFTVWTWQISRGPDLTRFADLIDAPAKNAALRRAADVAAQKRKTHVWLHENCPAGYRWEIVREVAVLPDEMTVAIEVDDDHAWVDLFVEHNTHGDARLVLWWVMVHAPGSARVVTTASRMRQVITQLWPHIRRAHAQHHLPGKVDAAQWKMTGLHGQLELVAWGFTPPHSEPEAVQGEHAPHVLIIIDEAGLINPLTGQAWLSASTGEHTRVLATGNPPTDEEGSWLEFICSSPNWTVLPITAMDTPNWTGEQVRCKACHDWRTRPHEVSVHLITHADAELFANDYGEDSAFYKAKVLAQFTKGAANLAIPSRYVEASRLDGREAAPLTREDLLGRNPRIRLGVDTSQGGADRTVIARNTGRLIEIVFEEQGEATRNTFDVAGFVKRAIEESRRIEQDRGWAVDQHKNLYGIDVVIDATGDRGPRDTLQAWNDEGLLGRNVHIIGCNFGERADDPTRYANRRAELWWNLRELLQPGPDGICGLYQDISNAVAGELASVRYKTNLRGQVQLESKDDLRLRGRRSPDHADAIAMSVYDPPSLTAKRPRERVFGA